MPRLIKSLVWQQPLVMVSWRGGCDMQLFTFQIIIEKEPEDPGYYAYSPALPGCFSNGMTVEDAKANMRDAIQQHIEVLRETGQEIPQRPVAIHIEELVVGLPA
jgi:predicted RNase H-like HicB family nuclease